MLLTSVASVSFSAFAKEIKTVTFNPAYDLDFSIHDIDFDSNGEPYLKAKVFYEGDNFTVNYTDGSSEIYMYNGKVSGTDYFKSVKNSNTKPAYYHISGSDSDLKRDVVLTFSFLDYYIPVKYVLTCKHSYVYEPTPATTKADGKILCYCRYCMRLNKSKSKKIYRIKTIKLAKSAYQYDGKTKKPSVTVKDSKGNKIAKKYYTVKYSKNKAVGTAKVKITFNNDYYKGNVTKTFKINPKGTSISKISPKPKGFSVKWKRQKTPISGYQIQYAANNKFTKKKVNVNVSGNTKTSKTVAKLSAKKNYYVRIRTYKVVKGKKYYSSWSKPKSVKTK